MPWLLLAGSWQRHTCLMVSCYSLPAPTLIPGQLMGALRVNIPPIMITGGPVLAGK
ncbi:hypothetical protein DRJ12_03205 [Candidatus Acetothermia bacterium]|nr:MAG: hypothetical protein DRJ12_03205 [Candidatus Acetothermia bacterium]